MLPPELTRTTTTAERYLRFRSEDSSSALERFLERFPIVEHTQLVEVLLVDQALEWREEPGLSVEEYLHRFPAVAMQGPVVLELVYGEIRARRALGLPVDVNAYAVRFPDLAEPLRRQLEVSAWLAGADGDSAPAGSPHA